MQKPEGWRQHLYEIIFEADTRAGKVFDVVLLVVILLSVLEVMLESVTSIEERYHMMFVVSEWAFTIIFSLELIVRLMVVRHPWRYVFSFFGLVDIMAIMPTFLELLLPSVGSLLIIRVFRLLRVFRIFKLGRYIGEGEALMRAIIASRYKISVFLGFVVASCFVMGTFMYIVETPEAGFTSIPRSIYWAIVTLTTVGYGDIAPVTVLGQTVASIIMILGYAIIAIPTGIVSAEFLREDKKNISTQVCPECLKEGHDQDAKFCKFCGAGM